MAQAKGGDTVKVHYTGKYDDGSTFDSSHGREPLQVKLGEQQVIPGFEKAILGMEVGEKKTVKIAAEDAYGPYHKEMVVEADRSQFPPDLEPAVGQQLQTQLENGQPIIVTVIAVADDKVTLDGNHPLAGKDLNFDIELLEVV